MAIILLKEPSGIYPAYNDSFIEFKSSITGSKRAEITIFPTSLFGRVFTLFPDSEGRYIFNLKEVVKVQLNQKGFSDFNFFEDVFFKSINGLYLLQSLSIEVFGDAGSDVLNKSFEFYKSVKQVGEKVFLNPFQILNYSDNGFDYSITYFEGFPFFFDVQRIVYSENKIIKVRNKNTTEESIEMKPVSTGAFRFLVDKGEGENWTSENILALNNGLNRLEILEDGNFRTNLILNKKKVCEGVYLKWFNTDGSFSHFLFQKFFKETIKGKDIDMIGSNDFQNIDSLNSKIVSIGKKGQRRLKIKAVCNEAEANVLRSLYISPMIQIYSSQKANVKGVFINVEIEDTFEFRNKKGMNEFVLTVNLPELITATL